MNVLLDTCAILWAILEPERLGEKARSVLSEEDTLVQVSPISCAEIACSVERGRIELDRHWKPWFRHFVDHNGWQVVNLDLRVVEEAYSLPEYAGRDPADRIIVATARLLQCPVVTADQGMTRYPHVDILW